MTEEKFRRALVDPAMSRRILGAYNNYKEWVRCARTPGCPYGGACTYDGTCPRRNPKQAAVREQMRQLGRSLLEHVLEAAEVLAHGRFR